MGRTRLLVAKLIALIAFVLFAIAAVLVTSYLTGLTLFGTEAVGGGGAARGRDLAVRRHHHAGRAAAAAARRGGVHRRVDVGVAAIALFLSTSNT